MDKLLVFTDDYNVDGLLSEPVNFFKKLGIDSRDKSIPVCFDANGKVTKQLSDSVLIILPDRDIIGDKNEIYPEAYQALQQLADIGSALLVVRHGGTDGWNYRSVDDADPIRGYLNQQFELVASHNSGSFYCSNMKEIAESVQACDPGWYKHAIEDARKCFPDVVLERVLKEYYERPPLDLRTPDLNLLNRKLIFIVNHKSQVEVSDDYLQFPIVDTEDAFRAFPFDKFAPDGIVIVAELTWNGKRFSDFYGIEVLQRLRFEHRIKCKTVICSPQTEDFLRKQFPILDFTQHHPLIKPPVLSAALVDILDKSEKIEDESRLVDIITKYCDPIGRMMHLLDHRKGFRYLWVAWSEDSITENVVSGCKEDLLILKRYLRNDVFDSAVVANGKALYEYMIHSLNTNDVKKLFNAKDKIEELYNLLMEVRQSRKQYA